jgi:hypothetical protein
MQTEEKSDGAPRALAASEAPLSLAQRLLMLLLNCLPFGHALAVVFALAVNWASPFWRGAVALAVLYLLPALGGRLIRFLIPIREPRIPMGSREFFAWWAMFNCQALFCRFPALEEAMRLVPGLYSAWLRLWGSRIGRLTYWGAGLRALDRSFLIVGDGVIFGAAVRINPHVMARNDQGQLELLLAPVTIGSRSVIGGYSLLTAGTEIAPGECTRAFLVSPPFSRWKDGSRLSKTGP